MGKHTELIPFMVKSHRVISMEKTKEKVRKKRS
jgi:hypothetical protein